MSPFEQAIVVLLSLAGVGSALAVVLGRDLFRSTLFFGAFLLVMSGLYFSLEASFIAIMQVFVYVGGVVVMILFGIMLTDRKGVQMNATAGRRALLAVPVIAFTGTMFLAITKSALPITRELPEVALGELGKLFMGKYVLPFEVVSVLLLAAVIGAVVVAKEREQ